MKEIKEHTTIKTGSLVKSTPSFIHIKPAYGVVIERRWGDSSMFEYRIHWTSGARGWWYPNFFEVVAG